MKISLLTGLVLALIPVGLCSQGASAFFTKASSADLSIEGLLDRGEADSVRLQCAAWLDMEGKANLDKKARAYFYVGQAAFQAGDFAEAEQLWLKALEAFEEARDTEGQAVTHTELGMLAHTESRQEEANTYFDQALALAAGRRLNRVLYRIYFQKASDPMEAMESVIPFLHQSLNLAEELNDPNKQRDVYEQLANQHRRAENIDSSIYYFSKLLDIHSRQQDSIGVYDDFSTLGGLYSDLGNYTEAQTYLFNALNLAEEWGNDYMKMSLYTRIAEVYLNLKNWSKAREYSALALDLANNAGIKRTMADNLRMQGFILRNQGDTIAAIQRYEEALDIYHTLQNSLELADVLIELASFYQDNANYNEARPLLEEALTIRQRMSNPLEILKCQLLIGKLEVAQNNNRRAITLLTAGIQIALEKDSREDLKMAYALLAQAYSQEGQYPLALESFQNFHAMDTSLLATKNAAEVHEIDQKYRNAQLRAANARYEVTYIRQKSQIRQLIVSVVAVCMLAVSLFFIFFKNRQLHKQKIRLLQAEQESEKLRSVIEGEEKERRRIGRELHDGLGAVLATVKMQINALQRKRPELENLPSYQKAEHLIDEACSNVREISHNLMPGVLEQQGLNFAVQDLCQTVGRSTGLEITFIPYGVEGMDDDEINIAVYRIVQELLKNVVKHAGATEVIVQLTVEESQLNLIVEDDGKGFDAETAQNHSGIGLQNILSRVNYLNGQFDIDSTPGEGSTFSIDIPLTKNKRTKS